MILGDEYNVIEEGCSGRTTLYDDPIDGWKNGMDYLLPCLYSHRPIDIMILMLGSNDLKLTFHLTAEQIAESAGKLVDAVKSFTAEKQEFVPKIILVSPPEIGKDIRTSAFYGAFDEGSIEESKRFPEFFRKIANQRDCIFFDAAKYIYPSEEDSLHLTPEGHITLAKELAKVVMDLDK